MIKFSLISFLLLLCACQPAEKTLLKADSMRPIQLGLNDVSILLPYNRYPELFASAPAIKDRPQPEVFAPDLDALALDQQAFVPESDLRAIDDTLQEDQEDQDDKTVFFRVDKSKIFDYRLTSLRIDPFRLEFRLVWQKTEGSGENLRFEDNNIHSIHKMTEAQFAAIVATLRELKAQAKTDTISLALQPNPTIVEEGLSSAYYKGVIGLVHRYIRASNLIEIAFLADTNQNGHWPLLKLAINQGTAHVLPIPGTEAKKDGSPFTVQRMDGFAGLDRPLPLGNTADNLFRAKTDQQRFANAFALENPRLHGVDNLDCANCHRANLEKEAARKRNPALQIPDSVYRSGTWNLEALFGIADEQSMQLFSYFLWDVKIAPRVINESAEVADFINAH